MRKFVKFLIPALLLVALVVACTAMSASAADEVIYISATGTGDGSSPQSPLGHGKFTGTLSYRVKENGVNVNKEQAFVDTPYADVVSQCLDNGITNKATGTELMKQHVFYRALEKLKDKTGTIVIMDEIVYDAGDNLQNGTASDAVMPESTGKVTFTSNYNGVDYRTNGAKLVLDHSRFNSIQLILNVETVWKDINLEYRYTSETKLATVNWEEGFSLYASGKNLTIDTGVEVTSDDIRFDTPGERYPNIFAGYRKQVATGDSVITIKSGTWNGVFAAGHCYNAENPGSIDGNSTVNISGGYIDTVYGSGSDMNTRNFAVVTGNVAINITGGDIAEVKATSSNGVTGTVTVDVKLPAYVGVVTPGNATAAAMYVKYNDGSVTLVEEGGFTSVEKTEPTQDTPGGDTPGNTPGGDTPGNTPVENVVIYVSATGTGDGSSATSPLGHGKFTGTIAGKKDGAETSKEFTDAAYADVMAEISTWSKANGTELLKQNALYRAFEALKDKTGTIVLMDEVKFDVAANMQNGTASDAVMPESTGKVTITSKYNGVDYRTSGAKLVLDHSTFNSIHLILNAETTWKDINIEYKYTSNTKMATVKWEEGFSLYACGKNLTIDTGVEVTSDDIRFDTPGDRYPNIFAGRRADSVTGNPVITIKSGTWNGVFAAGHGYTAEKPASVEGNSTINISGGKVNTVNGSGSSFDTRAFAVVTGNVAINLTGGTIETVNATSGKGVTGTVTITVAAPASVGTVAKGSASAKALNLTYNKGTVKTVKSEGFTSVKESAGIPQTGSPIVYLAVVALVSLAGACLLISQKRRTAK